MTDFKALSEAEEHIGKAVVNAAYKIHKELGPGLLEKVYEVCMAHELTKKDFDVRRQIEIHEKFSIDLPDPVEAIKFRMEQMGMTQTDLANIVGQKSRASEILNRKRKLSLGMIRRLHQQ